MDINNLDKEVAELRQMVKDGFKANDKSFKEVLRRQDHTNGNVSNNQKFIKELDNENTKIKNTASIIRIILLFIVVPTIGYLLICYKNDIERNVIMQENIKQLYERQLETREDYNRINSSIEKYFVNN